MIDRLAGQDNHCLCRAEGLLAARSGHRIFGCKPKPGRSLPHLSFRRISKSAPVAPKGFEGGLALSIRIHYIANAPGVLPRCQGIHTTRRCQRVTLGFEAPIQRHTTECRHQFLCRLRSCMLRPLGEVLLQVSKLASREVFEGISYPKNLGPKCFSNFVSFRQHRAVGICF